MTKVFFRFILALFIFPGFTVLTRAQSQDCITKLNGAETLFNNGIFEEVPPMLEDCMDLYSESNKQRAYRLIILAHYMNDDVMAAEEAMYLLLKEFPDYRPAANDLIDFHYVYNSFAVKKSMDLGITLGPAWTSGRIIEPYSPFSGKFAYRPSGPGIFAAAFIDIPLTPLLSLNTEPGYLLAKYEIRYEDQPVGGIYNIEQTETNSLIQLPVYAKATFLENQFQLFAKAGFLLGYLTGSKTQSKMETLDPDGTINYTTESIQQDHLSFRNSLHYFLGGGIGMKVNFKKSYLFTEADYHISLNKTLKNGTNRYDQPNLWSQGWIDSDFALRTFSVRVGMAWSIYTIKKIR
jgi:hypothetical protein